LQPLTRLESVLEERLARSSTVVLIQVMVRVEDRAVHELRHVDDDGVAPEHLTEIATASALGGFARRRDDGEHRPLRTAADLPRGWRLRASCIRDLIEALVEVYGSALIHWHLGETGELSGTSFREATAGQTGIYATLTQVETIEVETGTRSVCDTLPCLRTRLWGVEDTITRVKGQQEEVADRLIVPCPRPCPILFSGVLDLVAEGKLRDVSPLRQGVDGPPRPG
jgi:hypothetical protein